jgi:hypothetical protein
MKLGCFFIPVDDFRFCFAYAGFVEPDASSRLCDYVVTCKRCKANVPAPVFTMPDSWIIETCPACGAREFYLPNEIFQGWVSFELLKKPVRSEKWW